MTNEKANNSIFLKIFFWPDGMYAIGHAPGLPFANLDSPAGQYH